MLPHSTLLRTVFTFSEIRRGLTRDTRGYLLNHVQQPYLPMEFSRTLPRGIFTQITTGLTFMIFSQHCLLDYARCKQLQSRNIYAKSTALQGSLNAEPVCVRVCGGSVAAVETSLDGASIVESCGSGVISLQCVPREAAIFFEQLPCHGWRKQIYSTFI